MSEADLFALFVASKAMEQYLGTPFQRTASEAPMRALLPPHPQRRLDGKMVRVESPFLALAVLVLAWISTE